MQRVIHFEIGSKDPEKALEFYQNVFGWVITQKADDYYLVYTGASDEKGINGGMKRREKAGFVPTIEVKSLEASLKMVLENGGKVIQGTQCLPNTGYLAYCQDPEGNEFVLLEYTQGAE